MTRRLPLACSFVLWNMFATAAVAQDSKDQSTGHSFFGNWFGWGGDSSQSKQKAEQGTNPNQQSNRYGQSGAAHGTQQSGQKGTSDQVPPDPAYSETGALP